MKTHNFILAPVDTDSISFCKPDMSEFTEQEQEELLNEINSMMPKLIQYAHDGYFKTVVALKAKNYILFDGEELKIKGSSMRDPKKQPAVREFMDKVINCLVYDKKEEILNIYHEYIKEANNLKDISRWTKKITITESVLNPKRTNEQKVLDALKGQKVQMGDKIFVYFKTDDSLGLQEHWNNDHNPLKMMDNLYKGLNTFKNVLNMTFYTKFTLKSHEVQVKLAQLLGLPEPEKKTRKKKEVEV